MKKNFEELTSAELWNLRMEIVLDSIYFADYVNSFGFNSHDVSYFFGGYIDYLCELRDESGDDTISYLEFDTEENLYAWFNCYGDLSWIKYEKDDEE